MKFGMVNKSTILHTLQRNVLHLAVITRYFERGELEKNQNLYTDYNYLSFELS